MFWMSLLMNLLMVRPLFPQFSICSYHNKNMLQLMKHPAAIRAPVSHLASMNFSSNPQKLPHYPVPKLVRSLIT